MKLFTSLLLVSAALKVAAQDLKPLDYAPQYAKQKVHVRSCVELKYSGNTVVDTTKVGDAEFDASGRMIHYTEYFAKGRKMAEYTYEYDASGKMIRNTISLVFNGWATMELKLTHDESGRVISREMPEVISNFWMKETFTYMDGILVRSEQWFDQGGELKPLMHKDYPASLIPADNSLTYILDKRGLMILHQFYNKAGGVEKAWQYFYSE